MTRTDDQIESCEVPRLHGERKQRKQIAIIAIDSWNAFQPGCDHGMGLNDWRHSAALMKERGHRCGRTQSEPALKNSLPPTHPVQPSGHYSYAHPRTIRTRAIPS